jgi:hypothetical protein
MILLRISSAISKSSLISPTDWKASSPFGHSKGKNQIVWYQSWKADPRCFWDAIFPLWPSCIWTCVISHDPYGPTVMGDVLSSFLLEFRQPSARESFNETCPVKRQALRDPIYQDNAANTLKHRRYYSCWSDHCARSRETFSSAPI